MAARSPAQHIPVLLDRVVELFEPAVAGRPAVLVDATLGLGGHSAALLAAYPELTVIGLDRDLDAIAAAQEKLADYRDRVRFVHAVYDELPAVLAQQGISEVQGVLFDLGVSSLQLDTIDRGFSYARDAPLDMRMNATTGMTAAEVLNTYSVEELTRILREYGEERFAKRIASTIAAERDREPFRTSARLVDLLDRIIPAASRRTGGHPAKRTFQALRIEVNGELDTLRRALPAALRALSVGGRIVVESYHSLEDRMVKQAITALAVSRTPIDLPVELPGHEPEFSLVIRGAEVAGDGEIAANPRSASVRLRAAERIREAR